MQMKSAVLRKYLCFDEKKYPLERLFGDLKTFRDQYEVKLNFCQFLFY